MSKYPAEFYEKHKVGAQRSAEIVVPVIEGMFDPATVIDVGCGQGFWGEQFLNIGCEVVGIDGDHVPDTRIDVLHWDLETPMPSRFLQADLVVCLEVAEHLSPERAGSFVRELCQMAPRILWSAAIPGQGGNHHVNCRWPSWWAQVFRHNGYYLNDYVRDQFWDDTRIDVWYRQNLLIAEQSWDTRPLRDIRHPDL